MKKQITVLAAVLFASGSLFGAEKQPYESMSLSAAKARAANFGHIAEPDLKLMSEKQRQWIDILESEQIAKSLNINRQWAGSKRDLEENTLFNLTNRIYSLKDVDSLKRIMVAAKLTIEDAQARAKSDLELLKAAIEHAKSPAIDDSKKSNSDKESDEESDKSDKE